MQSVIQSLPIPGEEVIEEAVDEVVDAVVQANEKAISKYIRACAIEIAKQGKWPTEKRVEECVRQKLIDNAQEHLMTSFKAVYDLFLKKLVELMGSTLPDIPGF